MSKKRDRLGLAVFYASDGGDYDAIEASAWSVRNFLGDDSIIFILTENYWPPAVGNITLLNPCSVLRDLNIFPMGWSRELPFSSIYPLAIPLLQETKDIDIALVLSSKTLVNSSEIKNALADIKFGKHDEVIGVEDEFQLRDRKKKLLNTEISCYTAKNLERSLHSDNGSYYINPGVVAINLKKIRDNGLDWYAKRVWLFWLEQLNGKFFYLYGDFINVMLNSSSSLDKRLNSKVFNEESIVRNYEKYDKSTLIAEAKALGYYRYAAAGKEMPGILASSNMIPGDRQLVLYISHEINDESILRYKKLRSDIKCLGIQVLWCCNYKGSQPDFPSDITPFLMSDRDIEKYREYLFTPYNSATKYSCPAVFTLICFKELKDNVDYIWCIEHDVCYSGNWATFFKDMSKLPHDLIAEKVSSRYDEPHWMWWRLSDLNDIHWKYQYKCLNCIARVSKRLAGWLDDEYSKNLASGNCGLFFENAWPTVAIKNGSIYDIYERYCDKSFSFNETRMTILEKDKLYHAVKLDTQWNYYVGGIKESTSKNQLVAAEGQNPIKGRLISAVSSL